MPELSVSFNVGTHDVLEARFEDSWICFGIFCKQIRQWDFADLHQQQQQLMLQLEQHHHQVISFPFWGCNRSCRYASHKQVTAKWLSSARLSYGSKSLFKTLPKEKKAVSSFSLFLPFYFSTTQQMVLSSFNTTGLPSFPDLTWILFLLKKRHNLLNSATQCPVSQPMQLLTKFLSWNNHPAPSIHHY